MKRFAADEETRFGQPTNSLSFALAIQRVEFLVTASATVLAFGFAAAIVFVA